MLHLQSLLSKRKKKKKRSSNHSYMAMQYSITGLQTVLHNWVDTGVISKDELWKSV